MKGQIALVLLLALSCCDKPGPVAKGAENTSRLPVSTKPEPSPAGGPPTNGAAPQPQASVAGLVSAVVIPAALQGRWGLTPADCTSSLDRAKGLMVVGGHELRFYESRAVPGGNTVSRPDSFNADFHFTGEGQTWVKFETLQRKGDRLVRTESDPMASFTYARCQ